jgi:hypothetical protein
LACASISLMPPRSKKAVFPEVKRWRRPITYPYHRLTASRSKTVLAI